MLEPGKSYHVYNRANGFEPLFRWEDNYRYFLLKFEQHISPIADVFCYCLMKNHIHFFIRVKEMNVVVELIKERYIENKKSPYYIPMEMPADMSAIPIHSKFGTLDELVANFLSKQFSNLFSAYAQAFNKQQKRTGGLFQKPFKENWLKDWIIHNN